MKKLILLLPILSLFFLFSSSEVFADSQTINFETPTYSTGNINGQDGWSKTGSYDAAVVSNTYGYSSFGSQSFRISDAVTSGSFGDQTFAKPLVNAVGEADSTAGSFSTGTLQRHFEMQFAIASTMSTQQSGMHLSVSPDRGDGSRMSYLRFEDGTSGMNVFFEDVQGTTNPANFVETQIATGLSRFSAHTVKLTLDAIDGPSNDVVKVWIDGTLVHTGTSWENYYRYDSESSAEQSTRIIKTVLFRESGTANSADSGNGFLIDNLSLRSGPIPFNLNDATSNANNLTNHGATEWLSDFPFIGSTKAVNLSASNYLSSADNTAWKPTPNMTIEFWAKFNSLPGSGNYPALISNLSATNGLGWYFFYDGDTGKIRFYIQTLGSRINVSSNTSPVTGSWHHYAVTFDETTVKFYLDGVPDGSVTAPITLSYESGQHPLIGAVFVVGMVDRFIDAKIDDVRIWNTTRTGTEINDNKSIRLTGSESGLAAYYPFEAL